MKVRAIASKLSEIQDPSVRSLLIKHENRTDRNFHLEPGEEFTVYGVAFFENYPWYYIKVPPFENFPAAHPKDLFEVIDPRLSKYWELSSFIRHPDLIDPKSESYLVFKEWAEDPIFYEDLIDSQPMNIEIFNEYKILMDCEYSSGQYTQMVFEFLFRGSMPKKPLEELCTIRAIRESFVVHQFKLPGLGE